MTFAEMFREARERAGLTQRQLADAMRVSPATIISWESGRRKPGTAGRGRDGRQLVIEACDALAADSSELNAMLASLGLSPVPSGRNVPLLERRKPLAVIRDECATYAWPTLAMNEDFEVVAWNDAANDLSELDLETDLAEPGARHLLRMALSKNYRDKLVNWDEVIGEMVAMWKNTGYDPLAPGEKTPAFASIMAYVVSHHPGDIGHLLQLFQGAPPRPEGMRMELDVAWRTSAGEGLRFNCVMRSWSEFDGVAAFDWHPADGATWEWLDARREERRGRAPAGEAPLHPEPSSARALLRAARERYGFSRAALSERSRLSESLIYGLEKGTKPLHRGTLLALATGMVLDVVALNAILEAAGFDPEPSEQTGFLLGYEAPSNPRFDVNLAGFVAPWTPASIAEHISHYNWPAIVVNERCEALATNAAAVKLLGLDLRQTPPGPPRNLFAIVTDEPFRRAAANWEVAVANVLPGNLEAYMAPPGGHRTAGKDAAYFDGVIQHVRDREARAGRGDRVIHELFAAWRANPNRRLTARVTFPLEWSAAGERLRFNTIISPWNTMFDPYWIIDLHPADGGTWEEISG